MPVPSANQLAWHKGDLMLMTHFSLETFAILHTINCIICKYRPTPGTRCDTTPTLFNPVMFDANQWVAAAKAGGFKGILAMAKHNDGFCTWQTRTTTYSVVSSPWKGGKGDVVKELADAFHAAGLRFGLYCSPFDLNYCDSQKVNYPTYTEYFGAQLRELLTNYGTIDEIWFDGNGQEFMDIDWENIYQVIFSCHQPLVSFQGCWFAGDPIRVWWSGSEEGIANETNWIIYPIPDSNLATIPSTIWWPYESDVALEGVWFWEDWRKVASLDRFKDVYLRSVGRSSPVMINIAPNPSGLIDTEAVNRLIEFKAWQDSIYTMNIAQGKTAIATSVRENDPTYGADKAIDSAYDTYWAPDSSDAAPSLEVDLNGIDTIRMFVLQEYIPLGQRVANHTIQTWDGNQWNTVGNTTRWCACDGNAGHWYKVDLGNWYDLTGTQVIWESKNGNVYKYRIETSLDDVNWTLQIDKTANTDTAQTQTDHFGPSFPSYIQARYVRITITGLDPGCWASFYEFKAFIQHSTNVALNKRATADCDQPEHPVAYGNDDAMGSSTTIGFKRIFNLPSPIAASKVRLLINRSRSFPLINNFSIIGTHVPSAIKWAGPSAIRQSRVAISAVRRGHIRLLGPVAKNIIIALVRTDGRIIKRQQFFNTSGTMDFPIPPHASGVYILKASIGGRVTDCAPVFLQ